MDNVSVNILHLVPGATAQEAAEILWNKCPVQMPILSINLSYSLGQTFTFFKDTKID